MSTRAYDYILTVSNTALFNVGNVVYGANSASVAEIVALDSSNLRIKLANAYSEFEVGELLVSNSAIVTASRSAQNYVSLVDGVNNTFPLPEQVVFSDSIQVYADGRFIDQSRYQYNDDNTITFIPVLVQDPQNIDNTIPTVFPGTDISNLTIAVSTGDTESQSFISHNAFAQLTTANSVISAIFSSPYIAEKNSSQQTPLVALFTLYYPGEWYPPTANGNPGQSGQGFPWPYPFPLRYAQVVGEAYSDFNYAVAFGGEQYRVVALDRSDISVDSTGKIGELSLTISNFDGVIGALVDNPNIAGYNPSNSTTRFVNGDLVVGLDPRTVPEDSAYDPIVEQELGTRVAMTYERSQELGGVWQPVKEDSRDLLGAIVEVRYTYAKFLDYWPEYSIVREADTNSATMYSSLPYRVGDVVTSNVTSNLATVVSIDGNVVRFDAALSNLAPGAKLLIVNPDADPASYVEYKFVISRLDELNEITAKFNLTNWLQYFKLKLPKRKFYDSTCPWKYRGVECKYPQTGTGAIAGSNPALSANGYFTYQNVPTVDVSQDICNKSVAACALRRNLVNFGGFPNVKRQ